VSDAGAAVRPTGRFFVGREREIGALEASLRVAATGQGQLVAVVGDAGIGKTRTVEQFLARADAPEARVLWGRCPGDEGVPAYWPWAQLIRLHIERSESAALRTLLGRHTAPRVRRPTRDRLGPAPSESGPHDCAGRLAAAGIDRRLRRDGLGRLNQVIRSLIMSYSGSTQACRQCDRELPPHGVPLSSGRQCGPQRQGSGPFACRSP
jgi:hypothetical protein